MSGGQRRGRFAGARLERGLRGREKPVNLCFRALGGESVCGGRWQNEFTTRHPNPMNSFVIFARRLAFSLILAAAAPVIAGGLSLTIAGPAAAAVASSITVKGNQRIEAETIKTYITIKPGKSYGPADIDTSIKTLFDTGLFADVSIAQRGIGAGRYGGREPDHQFGDLRGQQEGQGQRPGAGRRGRRRAAC